MLQYFQQAKAIQQKYTLQDFLFRWKKIERVVQKQSINGLLLITGLHALDSPESAYLFNWLFLGMSGRNIYSNKYLHESFSECLILIHPESSFIFLTPKAKIALQHLIYGIPNCTIFIPTDNQYNNKQVLDTLKITFFYQMVESRKTIGVFLQQTTDVKVIQKWPLIQTYALEPVGRTFFTLQHKVINMNAKIVGLFKNLDKHSLKNLVGQTSFSMQGHIKGATNLIELTQRVQRGNITQKQLQQSMQQTVDIGLFDNQTKKSINLQQKVRVLFGTHTVDQKAESSKQITCSSQFHFTLQHYDPYTQMQVWRTYFLDENIENSLSTKLTTQQQTQSFLTKKIYTIESQTNIHFSNQKALLLTYLSLVQGTLDTITIVSKDYRNLNVDFLRQSILAKINQATLTVYGKQQFTSKDLQVWIESFDSFGQPRAIDFKDVVTFKLTSTFYVLKCRLNNIKQLNSETSLGSVIFSESFLLQEGCFLLLTKNIPYFDFWACQSQRNQLLNNLNPNIEFEALGKSVYEGALKNRVFVPLQKLSNYHFNIPILDVKYYFHEKGIRIYNSKIGWKMIFYRDIEDLTLINKIPGEWVLFRLKYSFLFQPLESNILFIQFRGKAFEILLKKINDKNQPLKLNYLQEIPPVLSQNWYFTGQVLKKQIKSGAVIHNCQILQSQFLWSFIEAKQLMILNMKDIKLNVYKNIYQSKLDKKNQSPGQNNAQKHNLLLITGTYGSNKLKLAQTISKFGPATSKYSIFNISCENLFARIEPNIYLQMLQQHINDNNVQSNKNQIIIAVIPSWLDVSKTIPLLNEKYFIRSVLSKVSSNNFFTNKNKNLVENVLTFCLPGFTQNIILDASAGDQDSLLSSISKILWVFNSQAKISRANNGIISSGLCSDIVKDESYSNEFNQFLRNKYSSFYRFDSLNSLEINYIEFKLPFYDFSFVKSLTKTGGYLIDYAMIIDSLKDKKRQAQNSKDQLMESLYQLQQSITIFKRRQKVTHLRLIKAVIHLNQEKGDKEFVWANKQFREKNIQEKSKQRGFFVVSRNFNQIQFKKFLETFTYKKILFEGLKENLTVIKLSEEQRKNIQRENRNKYLDNGDYFDGYFYRNIQGYILPEHPHLQRILTEWVNEKNTEIEAFNSNIKKEWNKYLHEHQL